MDVNNFFGKNALYVLLSNRVPTTEHYRARPEGSKKLYIRKTLNRFESLHFG